LELAFEIDHIEVVQSEFNFFQNEASETLFPYLKKNDISFMSWGTLDKGILTGRVDDKRKFEKSDCRSWAPWWKNADHKSKFDIMKKIWPVLEKHNFSGLELALGYNLNFPEVSMALCGCKNREQLLSLFKALEHLPGKDFLAKISEITKV
jgi:aryl-alcohol dehydrogenase-like predicted oxidoreductase